jgi:hypothetical protein
MDAQGNAQRNLCQQSCEIPPTNYQLKLPTRVPRYGFVCAIRSLFGIPRRDAAMSPVVCVNKYDFDIPLGPV